ncbi:MAG: hypothetical protein ACK5UM_00955 [Pseudomonadota bacterium]|jgi:hypothetical protein
MPRIDNTDLDTLWRRPFGVAKPTAPSAPDPQRFRKGSSPVRPTTAPPTRAVHAERMLALLKLVRAYGHVRAHEVALCLYRDARYGQQLAQRLLKRAYEGGLLLQRRNTLGGNSYVLAEQGVAQLDLAGLRAQHGRDIVGVSGPTLTHRLLATQYLLTRARSGLAFGEYAVAHGQAPVSRETLTKRFGKLPDGLVVYDDQAGPVVDVVEVEVSAKPLKELVRCLAWAECVGSTLGGSGTPRLARLVFVFDGSQGHARRILRAARERWGHCGPSEQTAVMRRVVLCAARVGAMATWHGCDETTLAAWAEKQKKV